MRTILSRTIKAFRQPAFLWLWIGSNFTFMSMMASGLTLGWLVLELTDSPFWVGAVSGARGIGQLVFSIFAGVLLDRYDKRRILLLAQTFNTILPFVLALLVFYEQIALWHLLAGSFVQGLVTSVRAPAFNTITYQLVGSQGILNASAAMSLGFNIALVLGSSVTGVLVEEYGEAFGLLFSAAVGLIAVATIYAVRGSFKTESTAEPVLKSAAAGIKYVWARRDFRKLLSLSLIIETFGFSYNVMLPVIARDVLGLGAAGLGALSAARGIGAGVSNVWVASLGDYERKSRLLVTAVSGAGIFMILFGLSPWYVLSLALIFILGGMLTVYDVTMKSLILLLAEDEWRGRVQSIYTLTYSFVSIGGFLAGILATAVSASFALAVSGSAILSFIGWNGRSFLHLSFANDTVTQPTD
ncbi:MAG: MFS transporter [Chloroflexota bacterium]